MPLSIEQIRELTPTQVLEYVPLLRGLDPRLYDNEHILRPIANAVFEGGIEMERAEAVRTLMIRHRHSLSPIVHQGRPDVVQSLNVRLFAIGPDGVENELRGGAFVSDIRQGGFVLNNYNRARYPRDEEWWLDAPTSFYPASDNQYLGQHTPQQLPLDGMANEGRLRRKMREWEKAFLLEEAWTDFPEEEQCAKKYDEIKVLEDKRKAMGHTLKEIAKMVPPGTLGMHMADGQPYNLVYRAQRESDPRKKVLKGTEWREVKDVEEVLWAAATLEAYKVLEETGLEFELSHRAWDWLSSIIATKPVDWKEEVPLFDFQRDAVSFLYPRDRAMLSLSPGLGKTLTSAYAAGVRQKEIGDVRKILLVCPASLLFYWLAELWKWDTSLPFHPLAEIWHKEVGAVPSWVPEDSQFWAITNPETLVRFDDEFKNKFDMMIVDESIMYKHRESIRSQKLNSIARTIDKVWLLTGAPATRYLDDFWHQFHILNNRGYSSYWRFADRYCFVENEVWGKTVVANRRGAEEMIKNNFSDIYFARNQDQVADIPEWLFEDVDIPMKPKQDAIYQKLRKELKVVIEGFPRDKILKVTDRMALVLRSLQVASNPILLGSDNSSGKWSALKELLNIYPGPYLIWVNYIRTGEMVKEMLLDVFGPDKVELANGSTSMADRNNIVSSFQDGAYDALVLNSTVGKFGFTLTKARTAIFLERNFDDSYFQCLHRNRRIGTEFSPVVVNMRSVTLAGKKTIDHVVHDALDYRNGMIKKITVGDVLDVLED